MKPSFAGACASELLVRQEANSMFSIRTLFGAICVAAILAAFVSLQQEKMSMTKIRADADGKKQVLNDYFIKELIRTPALVGSSTDDLADVVVFGRAQRDLRRPRP